MEGLIRAVLTLLQQAGIRAVRCFPGGMMPRVTAPVAAVSLERLKARDSGLGPAAEGSGRRVEAVVLLRVLSPDGAGGEEVCRVLLEGGLTEKAELAEPYFDDTADCFVTCVRAQVTGLLPDRTPTPDTTEFTDFRLEGEMK